MLEHQITDKAYNNSAIWVDFTKDERPRHFRLGVFGELKSWNPNNLPGDKNPAFGARLVVEPKHPFARDRQEALSDLIARMGLASADECLQVVPASRAQLELAHDPAYIETVERTSAPDPDAASRRLTVTAVVLLIFGIVWWRLRVRAGLARPGARLQP